MQRFTNLTELDKIAYYNEQEFSRNESFADDVRTEAVLEKAPQLVARKALYQTAETANDDSAQSAGLLRKIEIE